MGTFPKTFQQMVVDGLKYCDNIGGLSDERGVYWFLLYRLRD